MTQNTFTVSIHKEYNFYAATCLEIGTISQGDTVEEALLNLKEATALYLEEFPIAASASGFLTTFTTGIC